MVKYRVYDSYTAKSVTVQSTSAKKAIVAGRKRLPKTRGTLRAYKLKCGLNE